MKKNEQNLDEKNQKRLKQQFNITTWPNKKLNFWGITKCANTTIKYALLDNIDIKPDTTHPNNHIHNPSNVKYISKEEALQNGFTNFTITRNPYDRCVSLYKDFILKRNNIKLKGIKINRESINSFDAFVKIMLLNESVQKEIHFRTQTSFISNNSNICVDKIFDMYDTKNIENFIGSSLSTLNKSLGDVALNKQNKKIIYNIYREDFDNLGYSK